MYTGVSNKINQTNIYIYNIHIKNTKKKSHVFFIYIETIYENREREEKRYRESLAEIKRQRDRETERQIYRLLLST